MTAGIPEAPPANGPAAAPPPRRTSTAAALLAAARPRQWTKNVLVLAAPAAAGVLGEGDVIVNAALAFVAFCLVSSATYMLNDVGDVEVDRVHPTKRHRPIAAGAVGIPVVVAASVLLIAAGLGVALLVSWKLAVLIAGYKAMTLAYTFWLKATPTLDIVIVASGFLVRAIAGGVAVDVVLSQWFLVVASFGSLFMVAGKRHGELLGGGGSSTRPALAHYTLEHLHFVVSMSAAVTVVTYCLWAFEHPRTSDIPWWGLSIVPFVIGIMRYAMLVDRGHGGEPEQLVLRDPGLRLVGLAWLGLFLGSVYL